MIQILLAAFLVFLTILYLRFKSKTSFWRRQGVAEEPATFPFGSQCIWDSIFQRIAFTQITDAAYKNHPEAPLVGIYETFGTPSVVIRDLDLAKQILVKDFDKFTERKPIGQEFVAAHSKNNHYMAKMLTELTGKEWKRTRASLTPIFTSGKLKGMVPLMHKVADECNLHLETLCGQNIESKEFMKNFALDVIVSTGFGFDSNTFKDPDNIFKKNADLMIGKKMDFQMILFFFLFFISPKLLKWIDMPFLNKDATLFFANMVLQSIEQRKKDGTRRNDLIDHVLDVMAKESKKETDLKNLEEEGDEGAVDSGVSHHWTQDEVKEVLVANSLLMFLAGFDTVSSTASVMLHFLAKNQHVQEKLYQEISNAIQEYGDEKLDYATIMKLPYLDMVLLESHRCYPVTHLDRASGTDYKVPGTDIVIPKNTFVRIPVPAIGKDAKYFPDPETFNPENFTEEKKAERHSFAYGGFGQGPRNCIAKRFATMEVKIAVARIVAKFNVLPCEKTVDELIPDPKSRSFLPKGDFWFTVEKR